MRTWSLAALGAVWTGAASAQELPPLLEAAIAAAEARLPAEEERFAFTQTVAVETEGVRIVAAYDPSAAEPWRLVDPDTGADESQQTLFDELVAAEERPDRELLVEDPREAAAGCAGPGRTEGVLVVFACGAPAGDDDEDDFARFRDSLRAEIAVDPSGPTLHSYRLFAIESFKPVVVARVTQMDLRMTFAAAWEDGPLFVERYEQETAGSAMFRSFEQSVRIANTAFRPAD